ncbi:hypothetical protein Nmel_013000 [Mimus melanotis]
MRKRVVLKITETREFYGDYWQIDSAELLSKERNRNELMSTKAESVTGTLRTQTSNLSEISITLVQVLPIALLRICMQSRQRQHESL